MGSQHRRCLSQEDAIEDDHREVMAFLKGNYADAPSYAEDAPRSPPYEEHSSPSQSFPNMLDVSPGPLPARHGSIAGIGVGVTPPSGRRSKGLNLEPASSPLRQSSLATSPPAYQDAVGARSASSLPVKRQTGDNSSENSQSDVPADTVGPNSPSNDRQPRSPERAPSKAVQGRNATGAVVRGYELNVPPGVLRGRDYGQRNSPRGRSLDSCLPQTGRSGSPRGARGPGVNLQTPGAMPGRLLEDDGTNPSKSPELSPEADSCKSKEHLAEDVHENEDDPFGPSKEEPDVNSAEGYASSNPPEEPERHVRIKSAEPGSPAGVSGPGASKLESRKRMIDEAEEDSAASPPKPTMSSPAKQNAKKTAVHPRTNFNNADSGINTPYGSGDEEELSDIKKAQSLGIYMSSMDNTIRNRTIQTILRGDYLREGTTGGRRRQRKYVVATDLSEESVYALEWTIGTILRDGDTMYAVCALPEESLSSPAAHHGEGPRTTQAVASVVGSQTEETARNVLGGGGSSFSRALSSFLGPGVDSRLGPADTRALSNAEAERVHTADKISSHCVDLLRKTLLQVRVAVEVIHCKNPKHMITEAIDGLEPTLVIVGARGRSALKGVLLGSFSNYLITKSSVPVMVARKRLKQQTKQKKAREVRLSNNLSTPKSIVMATVD